MREERVKELEAGMKAFDKENLRKENRIPKMMSMQAEIVNAAFNGEHAETANLKITDVEKHLERLNEERGHIADEELQKFQEDSKEFCNLIRAEISGNKGEYKAFKSLEYMRSQNRILRNVELKEEDMRTELDLVVVTQKCLTIVEVKNTAKDIFIDEDGNYFRTGEFLKWDSNIAGKMKVKEKLLRKVIENTVFSNLPIRSVLVFTNNRIEVQNRYEQIRTCFPGQLSSLIDRFPMEELLSAEELDIVRDLVDEASCKEAYPFEFDCEQYKKDFAELMATLEYGKPSHVKDKKPVAEEETAEPDISVLEKTLKEAAGLARKRSIYRLLRIAGGVAATVAIITAASGKDTAGRLMKGGL